MPTGMDLIKMKNHPVLGDSYESATEFWEKSDEVEMAEYPSVAEYTDSCILIVDAIKNRINHISIEIENIPDYNPTFDEAIELVKKYKPLNFNKYKYSYSGVRAGGEYSDDYLIMYENRDDEMDNVYILVYTEPGNKNRITEVAITTELANQYDFDSSAWSYKQCSGILNFVDGRAVLQDADKIAAEIAKKKAETEFERRVNDNEMFKLWK